MKAFVLTIKDLQESQQAAERCIESGLRHGVNVKKHYGYTPKDNPLNILDSLNIPIDGFKEKYSYIEKCVAAFLGHRSLWEKAISSQENILVLEHDAELISSGFQFLAREFLASSFVFECLPDLPDTCCKTWKVLSDALKSPPDNPTSLSTIPTNFKFGKS